MFIRSLLLSLIIIFFAGCANFHGGPSGTNTSGLSASDYLRLAANANTSEKQVYLLSAAEQYLMNNQAEAAQKVLSSVNASYLNADASIKLSLLRIYYRAESGQASVAIEQLAPFISNPSLSNSNQILVHRILAKAYQQQSNLVATIDQMDQLQNLLPDSESRQQNLVATWKMIENLNVSTLQEWSSKTDSPEVRGWLDLAVINNTYYSPSAFLSAIKNWESEYPGHPAKTFIDGHSLVLKQMPKQVALLLPMKGSLASSSEAIRNGFFAAYYYAKQRQEFAPSITLYDTSGTDVVSVYQQAVQQGANFVVGPLTKNDVRTIAHSTLSVPTLALNSIQDFGEQRVGNLYQFDLSPVTEAADAATHGRQHNHSRAVIFALPSDWSQDIAKAFQQRWKSEGGKVVQVINIQNSSQIDAAIRQLMHAQVVENPGIGEAHYKLSHQADFDLVFLATSSTQARQIVPLLRFYYSGYLAVYATSLIYDGSASTLRNSDLNGISFYSMPWLVQPSRTLNSSLLEIRNRTQSLWGSSFSHYPKLYAVGVDAYDLIPELNKLVILPDLGARGATGRLYLSNSHYINRQLVWTEIHDGTAQLSQ